MTHHALYRFHSDTGELLYVGITLNPTGRWRQHRRHKPWWTEIARITIEQFPDRTSALLAETNAIHDEHPKYNIAQNPTPPATTQRPTTIAEILGSPWGGKASDMPDDCHDHCVKVGVFATYYPYEWWEGMAAYQCEAGHVWTCSWGHVKSGEALQHRGKPITRTKVEYASNCCQQCGSPWMEPGLGGALYCSDCGLQWQGTGRMPA